MSPKQGSKARTRKTQIAGKGGISTWKRWKGLSWRCWKGSWQHSRTVGIERHQSWPVIRVQEEANTIHDSLKVCRVLVGWEFGTLASPFVFYSFLRWMLYGSIAESNHCTEKEPASNPDSTKFCDLAQATSLYVSLLGSKMDYRIVTRVN